MVSKNEFLEFFQETITETSENINSVTLSWIKGNKGPYLYFMNTFQYLTKKEPIIYE